MTQEISDLAKEKDQQRIKVILGDLEAQLKALKDEFSASNEQNVIDTVIGKMPVYRYLRSHKDESMSMEELLFLPENRAALLDTIKSLPPNEVALLEVVKTNVAEYPATERDEQRTIRLLEKLVNILQGHASAFAR